MTATATLYTKFGFVMAADGRRSWGYYPTLNSKNGESETVQKIFEITRRDMSVAYCIRGDTVNENLTWDIAKELKNSVGSLQRSLFDSSASFMQELCSDLQRRIENRRAIGQIDGYPASEMCFVGYFRDQPFWSDVQFCSDRRRLVYRVVFRDCDSSINFLSGSQVLNQMIQSGDSRVAHLFLDISNKRMSLDVAVSLAKRYVETCCSPLIRALEIDGCRTVGGHIHIACVKCAHRPSLLSRFLRSEEAIEAKFQWIIPPAHILVG